MREIPDDQVVQLMREIVAEKGSDYVYPFESEKEVGSCVYFAEDADGAFVPMCIVGHLMHRIDFPFSCEGQAVTAQALPVSELAEGALSYAQQLQDRGEPWGAALAAFEKEMGVTA